MLPTNPFDLSFARASRVVQNELGAAGLRERRGSHTGNKGGRRVMFSVRTLQETRLRKSDSKPQVCYTS